MVVNVITGTADHDRIDGTAGRDLILAENGKDVVNALGGRDTVYGQDGDDTLIGHDGGNTLFGGDGNDLLMSIASTSGAAGHIYGGRGNDRIFASDAVNYVYGGADDDEVSILFNLGGEAEGGSGFDTLVMTLVAATSGDPAFGTAISVVLRGPHAGATSGAAHMALSGFERLDITTHTGDDTVVGGDYDDRIDVWSGANEVRAKGGNDIVSYHTGVANFLDGGDGTDLLQVTEVDPIGSMSFTVNGSVATDGEGSVLRNFERYSVIGGALGDVALLGNGADTFRGLGGNDEAMGMAGADSLWGGAGNDSLYGGKGDDVLNGGSGRDHLFGCADADTFLFDHDRDRGATIGDMVSGEDTIAIRSRLIGDVLVRGGVNEADFHLNTAIGTTGQFIYRASHTAGTNELIWDRNGTFEGGEVRIALFDHEPLLRAADLLIY